MIYVLSGSAFEKSGVRSVECDCCVDYVSLSRISSKEFPRSLLESIDFDVSDDLRYIGR